MLDHNFTDLPGWRLTKGCHPRFQVSDVLSEALCAAEQTHASHVRITSPSCVRLRLSVRLYEAETDLSRAVALIRSTGF